jgi:hypothetical protein
VVDSKAIMVLIGTEMDYVEDEIKSEFVFKNPNEKVIYLFNILRVNAAVVKVFIFE